MKILVLNVWEGGIYIPAVTDFVERMAPQVDVFCFQESDEPFVAIADRLSHLFASVHAHKATSGVQQYPLMTLVRRGIAIEESGTVLEEDERMGFGLWVTLTHSGSIYHVVNYHGNPRPGDKCDTPERLRASEALIGHASRMPSKRIIAGDFNLHEASRSVGLFEAHGYDNLIKTHNIHTTRNAHAWDRYPTKQLHSDYVFVSEEVTIDHFSVLPDIVSDHQPLLVHVS